MRRVVGSIRLVRALLAHDLVDELRVMIYPVVIGRDKRIFRDDSGLKRLRLLEGRLTCTGAVLARYRPLDAA